MKIIGFQSGIYSEPSSPFNHLNSHSRAFRGQPNPPPPEKNILEEMSSGLASLIEEIKQTSNEVFKETQETSIKEVVTTTLKHVTTQSPLSLSKKDIFVITTILLTTFVAVMTLTGIIRPMCTESTQRLPSKPPEDINPLLSNDQNTFLTTFSKNFFSRGDES